MSPEHKRERRRKHALLRLAELLDAVDQNDDESTELAATRVAESLANYLESSSPIQGEAL